METNGIKYGKRIFAFLDILGFERLVNESRNNPELVVKIAGILKRSKQIAVATLNTKLTILKVNPNQYIHRAFSDTSTISGPYESHDDPSFLSAWVMYYQYLMWKEQQSFLRGAIVYGDIYQDDDVVFGPALIDAYHLERCRTKAIWPRVLVDGSLLNRATPAELRRDFFEIFRQDNNDLVYLDYLRELFHLIVLAENKRITGDRERDFGAPVKYFEDHRNAILAQVEDVSKKENREERTKILSKYLELSEYHNSTIDELRQVINEIMNNNDLVKDLLEDQLIHFYSKESGLEYTPKYSAEEHPEQSDMLNIVGAVISRIIQNHQKDDVSLNEALDTTCIEVPNQLLKLGQSLNESKIDLQRLTSRF